MDGRSHDILQTGDQVPHFEVRTLAGDVFRYTSIWQHKNLVLVTLDSHADGYAAALTNIGADFQARQAVCVITRDRTPGVPSPSAIVADRWGEIVHVAAASDVSQLPAPSELLDWLDYIERRCPECEGEAK